MRLSIKAKQVAGVTVLVGAVAVALSALSLSRLARIELEETQSHANIVIKSVLFRANAVVGATPVEAGDPDPFASYRHALAEDQELRDTLRWSLGAARDVTFAALVDTNDVPIAIEDAAGPFGPGQPLPAQPTVQSVLNAGLIAQLRAIYFPEGLTLEVREPVLIAGRPFGAVRVGVTTLLIQHDLNEALRAPLLGSLVAFAAAVLGAMFLSQVLLRPIHQIRTGLTRLTQGDAGAPMQWPQERELAGLDTSFNVVRERLQADRSALDQQKATLASVVEHLEEAVALVSPDGKLLFANPSMRAVLPADPFGQPLERLLPVGHPYREAVERTLATGAAYGPVSASLPGPAADGTPEGPGDRGAPTGGPTAADRMILTNVIGDLAGQTLGVMLVARNMGYLSQVQSTLTYARKLAALGRLSAGLAHEVKNPLNATMIHLELLKEQLRDLDRVAASVPAPAGARGAGATALDVPGAMEHVSIIEAEMRRLDEVVQGFLRFTRPEHLDLKPVRLGDVIADLRPVIEAEATKRGVALRIECPRGLPLVNADAGLLQQAFLNLALNACQAMPHGGTLRVTGAVTSGGLVELRFEDTGAGIAPAHLDRIFDLYFTTKSEGTGIGLSMVYRTIQLHDGDIEVQSTLGRGTTFRLLFRRL